MVTNEQTEHASFRQFMRGIPWVKICLISILGGLALGLQMTVWYLEITLEERRAAKARAAMPEKTKTQDDSRESKTVHFSAPSQSIDLHIHRSHGEYKNTAEIYWNRAISTILADWDPTVTKNHYPLSTSASIVAPNVTLGLQALQKAADLGHPDAQYIVANAYASGFWPVVSQQGEVNDADGDNNKNNKSRITVQDTYMDSDNAQQAQAWLYWHMAAIAGNAEAAMTLAYRLGNKPANEAGCLDKLPYYQAAADIIVDELETDPQSRAIVAPAMDKHTLYQVHLHGGTGSKLDANNKPDETAEALQFYHVRAIDHTTGQAQSPQAAYTLAHLYHYGLRGVPQNLTQALHYYELAAKEGHWEAAGQAGKFFLWGMGVRQDPFQAHKLFRIGMPVGLEGCQRRLEHKMKQSKRDSSQTHLCDGACLNGMGVLHLLGLPMIVAVDQEDAEGYFRLAKEQGNVDAMYNLAMMRLGWKTHFKPMKETEDGQTSLTEKDLFPLPKKGDVQASHLTQGELQSILTDLTTAASKSHVQARHRLGMMFATGVKAPNNRGNTVQVIPKDCEKALKNFKWIIDNASPHRSKRLRRAYKQYIASDKAGSLRNYLAAAESGSELAQLNAAFLLERGECLGLSRIDCAKASVRLWKAAAARGHAEASLRVGDFYYYGRLREGHEGVVGPFGWLQYILYPENFLPKLWSAFREMLDVAASTKQRVQNVSADKSEEPEVCMEKDRGKSKADLLMPHTQDEHSIEKDLEIAAHYYRMAAERASSPRANFNLGFLYEWGLGLKQDFPLAKRHYDLASDNASQEAALPVSIALFTLNLHEYLVKLWMSWKVWLESKRGPKFVEIDESIPASTEEKVEGHPVHGSRRVTGKTKLDVILSHIFSWESLLILVLTVLLSVLLQHRRTRR